MGLYWGLRRLARAMPEVHEHDFGGSIGRAGLTMLVSVVIPSRDRRDLVARAVESVLDQGDDIEVIVVDDGSDPALVPEGPLSDSRVRIVRIDESQGPARARNMGLRESTGDFIAFLDDDDIWLPGKIQRCVEAAAVFPEAKVIAHRTAFETPRDALASGSVDLVTDPLERFGTTQTPHVNGVMVEARLARKVGFDETFDAAQDVDFMLELARRSSFVIIDEVLAVHGSEDAPSLVSLEKRIAARERLRRKHRDILYSNPRSRSFYHMRLAHLSRRGNDRVQASLGFLTALRYYPLNAYAWRGLCATALPMRVVRGLSLEIRARERV